MIADKDRLKALWQLVHRAADIARSVAVRARAETGREDCCSEAVAEALEAIITVYTEEIG